MSISRRDFCVTVVGAGLALPWRTPSTMAKAQQRSGVSTGVNPFPHAVASGDPLADRDFTVKAEPVSPQPSMTYYYRFSAFGVESVLGRTKTLPVGTVRRLRVAVA